jgi:ABC-2 type transport system permease protein
MADMSGRPPHWLAGLFRIRFINSLQYRTDALAGVVTQFGFGFMYVLLYMAFYRANPDAFPMTLPQTVTYIWLQQGLARLIMLGFGDRDSSEMTAAIISGEIAYELVRPADYFDRWACQIVASRCSGGLLRVVPMIIVAALLPAPYGLTLTGEAPRIFLFVLTSLLGMGVTVGITMLVNISVFYTLSPSGVRGLLALSTEFLSGFNIPIPFFPEPFRTVAELLPFGSMQNVPLRIFGGSLTGGPMLAAIGLQVFWVVVLWGAGRLAMNRALKKVIVQGG